MNFGGVLAPAFVLSLMVFIPELALAAAPSGLYYTPWIIKVIQNQPMTPALLTNKGGAPTAFYVSPAFPPGISINQTTGTISGTPTQISAATTYGIGAVNASGNGWASISIQVVAAPSPSPTPSSSPLPTPPILKTNSDAKIVVGSSVQGQVGADFMGFSYEKAMLSTPFFSATNAPLIALFSKWGPGILRIGGNTVNTTKWNSSGAGLMAAQTAPPDVDRLAGFLKATHWKVIYGLNATNSSTALTASEAKYVAQSLGSSLQDFEIGNEPDSYSSNGLEPTSFTFADFLSDWHSYVSAIQSEVAGAIFSGPASAYNFTKYTVPFAQSVGNKVEYLTQHYYRANGQNSSSTMDFLLTPDPNLPGELSTLVSAANANQIPKGVRMAETNSYYNGGAPGVSDGFGTSLWLIEYAFTLAQSGVEGANFHGGGSGTGYTPIANDANGNIVQVRPEYYGMLLFSLMGPGEILQTSSTGSASALYSYTLKNSSGKVSVVLANNSRTDVVAATVNLPAQMSMAQAMLLTDTNLDATTGMTLGGSSIDNDGSWSASKVYNVPIKNSSITIDVPSGSAYLLQASPSPSPSVGPRVPVGPQSSLTCPEDSVVISPSGTSFPSAFNSHGAGTSYCFKAGTYEQLQIVPREGDTYIGVKGAVLDGKNLASFAFSGSANNVTIENLGITNYTCGGSARGAIQPGGAAQTLGAANSWLIKNNEIFNNAQAGVHMQSASTLVANFIHNNGREGYTINGSNGFLIDNEISFNNINDVFSPEDESGGGKAWATTKLTVEYNYSHDNRGPGLWDDTDNQGITYMYNRVEHNQTGIMHEISWDAVIAYNVVKYNSNPAHCPTVNSCFEIYNSTSAGEPGTIIDIHDNVIVTENDEAFRITHGNRGASLYTNYGVWTLKNVHVHDNQVTLSGGRSVGVIDSVNNLTTFTADGNYLDYDVYTGASDEAFSWNYLTGDFSYFQSKGQEIHGVSK